MLVVITLLLVYASIYDFYFKKIPNHLSLSIVLLGGVYNYLLFGNTGLATSLYGLLTGLFISLFFFRFADLGAGDVKLISAIGSLVGYKLILFIIAYSYVISAVLGIVYIKLWLPWQQNRIVTSISSKPKTWLSQRIPMAPGISIATFYVLYSQYIAL